MEYYVVQLIFIEGNEKISEIAGVYTSMALAKQKVTESFSYDIDKLKWNDYEDEEETSGTFYWNYVPPLYSKIGIEIRRIKVDEDIPEAF